MDTTATIPIGAMAERWKWSAFYVYGFFVSTLVYSVFGNRAWGGVVHVERWLVFAGRCNCAGAAPGQV